MGPGFISFFPPSSVDEALCSRDYGNRTAWTMYRVNPLFSSIGCNGTIRRPGMSRLRCKCESAAFCAITRRAKPATGGGSSFSWASCDEYATLVPKINTMSAEQLSRAMLPLPYKRLPLVAYQSMLPHTHLRQTT